jgi:hypothetical protein
LVFTAACTTVAHVRQTSAAKIIAFIMVSLL